MSNISVRSNLLNPFEKDKPLTPAMVLSLWVIADAVDKLKLADGHDDAIDIRIPTSKLRGTEGRSDNAWLKVCLERMTGLKISGTYRGEDWGAVMLAQYQFEQGGAIARLTLPSRAIEAMRVGDTFAKIETHAAYRLQGHARTLYGALADKKRMGNKYWVYDLDELRWIMNVGDKKAYQRFNNFRFRVLDPAVEQINDFGTVSVSMMPQRVGRKIVAVRFDWEWKSISEARETDEENERLRMARRKEEDERDLRPLSETPEDQKSLEDRAEYRAWLAENPKGDFTQFYEQKHGQV